MPDTLVIRQYPVDSVQRRLFGFVASYDPNPLAALPEVSQHCEVTADAIIVPYQHDAFHPGSTGVACPVLEIKYTQEKLIGLQLQFPSGSKSKRKTHLLYTQDITTTPLSGEPLSSGDELVYFFCVEGVMVKVIYSAGSAAKPEVLEFNYHAVLIEGVPLISGEPVIGVLHSAIMAASTRTEVNTKPCGLFSLQT